MSEPAPELNLRERELLEFASAGASEAEIAAALGWPVEEVGPRLDRLAEKLGVDGRSELVGYRLPEVGRPTAPVPEAPTAGRASWDAGHHDPERRGGFPWQGVAGAVAVLFVGVVVFLVMTSGDDDNPARAEPTPTTEVATPRPTLPPTPTPPPLTVDGMLVGDATLGGDFGAPSWETFGMAGCEECPYAPAALLRVWREDRGEVQGEVLYQFTEDEPGTVSADRRDGALLVTVHGADGWTRFLRSTDGGATWEEEMRLEGTFGWGGPTVIWAEGYSPSGAYLSGWATYPEITPLTPNRSSVHHLGADGDGRGMFTEPGVTEVEAVWLVPDEAPAFEVARPVRGQFSARVRYSLMGLVGDPGTDDLLGSWVLFGQAGPGNQTVLTLLEAGEVVSAWNAALFATVLEDRWAFGTASYQSFGRRVEFFAALDLESGAMQRVPMPWEGGEVTGFFAVDVRVGE